MSNRALTLYDTDSDSDASSLAGDSRPMASMSIANDPCRKDNNSDGFSLDSDLETNYTDSEEEYITSEQAQKYNPANLRVEARRTLDYDSESDDDGNANYGYSAQDIGGFNRSVMANGMKDDEHSIGSDSDYDPIIRGRTDLPQAFVRNDKELDALLPVGHARDKVITTSTINPETGEKEIHQYREGEQERPSRKVRVISSAKQSAEIVSQALAKARADKTVVKKALGGKGEADLTEEQKKLISSRTKILQAGKESARQVRGKNYIETKLATEVSPERVKQLTDKFESTMSKKKMLNELAEGKPELQPPEKREKLDKIETNVKKLVDKRLLSETFKKMKAESQARALLKIVGQKIAKTVAGGKIAATFKKIVDDVKEKASAELDAEITRQQRQALANLLSSQGFASSEAERIAKGEEPDSASTIAGTEAETSNTARTTAITTAKERLENLQAEVEPIKIDDKELKVDITPGGKRQLRYDGKLVTSNAANLSLLQKIQVELSKTRRTDPVANAIRVIVEGRISQAKSKHGKGAVGGQGKRKVAGAGEKS